MTVGNRAEEFRMTIHSCFASVNRRQDGEKMGEKSTRGDGNGEDMAQALETI